jgi:predicted MFS family arabinose efflux permease
MAAFFIQTSGMIVGDTAIPLAMVGIGAMLGNLIEGRIASHAHRFSVAFTALCMGVCLLAGSSRWPSRSEPLLALCSFSSVALFCLGTVAGRGLGDRTPGAELWEGPRAGCGGMTSKLLLIDNDPGTS